MNDAPDRDLAAKVDSAAEQAEARAEQAESRSEQAEPRSEQAETRDVKTPRKRTSTKRPRKGAIALPVLVVEETLLMPHMSIPYAIEDEESAMVIERAMRMKPRQVLVLLEQMTDGDPESGGLIDGEPSLGWTPDGEAGGPEWTFSRVGVIAEVGQRVSRPGSPPHVILQAVARGVVSEIIQQEPYVVANVDRRDDSLSESVDSEAAMATVLEQLDHYVSMLPNVPDEAMAMVRAVDEPGWLADMIAFSPEFSSEQRQELLEELDPIQRLRNLSVMVQKRLNILNLRQQIASEAQAGMDRQQREYYLREQMRAIQKELGEGSPEESLAREMRDKIDSASMPEEVQQKALAQVERLEQQHPMSPEIGVIRTYLEWLTELPWAVETEDHLDLEMAAKILDEDHYGLDKVKERIIEYIAVRKLAGDKLRAPIICFVGPPGVGKTSLGRSIARAIGRNYVRMSLGGVRDEAEIRGHRRTYVGAMPGRVVKAVRDAKSRNPVIVLDEIDKVGSDAFRGDPSSALLEVLDPEQNSTFSDHYLEVPFDLSKVMFITTANLLEPIPPALRDRMEIIEVPGYTEVEKLRIARDFLFPKALESHGLTSEQLSVSEDAFQNLVREYTSESGVRSLEREVAGLCRKVARIFAGENPPERIEIGKDDIATYLGISRFEFGLAEEEDSIGVATGAAYTSSGGDLLSIEVSVMEGKGELILTGQLGDVMRESARAAISYARSRSADLGIEAGYFDKNNIHIHIPAGAIPKDGPSAGITMATALISALCGRPIRKDVAMTGEITLRGRVLPIGGLREKTLAAHRGGIRTFLLPKRNAKDLAELPEVVKQDLELILVNTLDEVLAIALLDKVEAKTSLHVA